MSSDERYSIGGSKFAPGAKVPPRGYPEGVGPDAWVYVKVSRELAQQLGQWSRPVQVLITRQGIDEYDMIARDVIADPKMLRETLCLAQSRIGDSPLDRERKQQHIERLQRLIDLCDVLRPIGPDGKHGARHTPGCGCSDKPMPCNFCGIEHADGTPCRDLSND